jgi:hypothetical protein
MRDVKRQTWWKRRRNLTPGEATLLGFGIGWTVALVSAFTPPHDFSYSFLLHLLLSLGPFGALSGYMLWLVFDPVREERLRRLTSLVAFPTILGLLVVFPDFWRAVARSMGPGMVGMLMGFACSIAMLVVVAGLGMLHLAVHLASSFRWSTKPGAVSPIDEVWDRELDQG